MPNHTIFDERPQSQDRALRVLEKLGYKYIPRGEAEAKRLSLSRVLFEDELQSFLKNEHYYFDGEMRYFSSTSVDKAIRAIDVPITAGLSMRNKEIYDLLCDGKSLEEHLPGGNMQSFDINYINFDDPEKNIFQVTDEFAVERPDGKFARPDIVVLINGIPVVVIECKKSSVDVMEGVKQNIRNWGNDYIPQLFKFSQLVLAINPNKVLYGTCGTPSKHFVAWHEDATNKEWLNDWCRKCSPDGQIAEQDKSLISLLEPTRLLEIIRSFILYDDNVKKVARYKQYFAIKKCMTRIKGEDDTGSTNGVVWHTQGSGKSLTMVMLTKLILRDADIKKPRFIMVTDRVNLDKQIRDNFISTSMSPTRAKTGPGLVDLLREPENTVITALINKFEAAIKQDYVNDSDNIYLFIDEGHRTQYGRLNIYMNRVLPNAKKIAFTGTPLLNKKKGIESAKNTYQKFGPLIDKYTLQDAIDDKVTVPIIYEGRVIPQSVTSEKINDHLKYLTVGLTEDQVEDLKRKWSRFVAIAQTNARLDMIAFDIHEHFLNYVQPKGFKAILTCSSRAAAVEMFYKLKCLGGIMPAVVITANVQKEGDDDESTSESAKIIADFFRKEIDPLYKNNYERYEEYATSNFVNPDGEIDLLIVKDKLLTGFDAPVAGVLYVDKKLQDHTLLQAIARVNRVYESKDFGLIVDYIGVFSKLNSALDLYSDEKSGMNGFDPADITNAISSKAEEKTKLEVAHQHLWELFKGIQRDEKSSNVWEECLRDYDIRKDFYEKLSDFAKTVDFLYTSFELFELVGHETAEKYRSDYLFFRKLKNGASIRFNDTVDFSKYEDGIRHLLDTYVNAEDAKIVIEPLDILNKDKMQEQLDRLGSKESKAEAIQTRTVEILESTQHDDPVTYMTFMERIKKTISDYLSERDAEKYLASMEKMAEDYREGRGSVDYPSSIVDDSDCKVFFGAIKSGIAKSLGGESLIDDEIIAALSISVKAIISSLAKRDWRENIVVHRNIKSKLDDLIFTCIEDHHLNWPLDTIDIIIDEIMLSAKKRY